MDESKILAFIKKLSNDTANDKLSWQRLNDYANMDMSTSPEGISYMLFQTEFRHIDFHTSYYATIGRGAIYVLNEDLESGRDGTHTSGYKLYLQDDFKATVSDLPCPKSAVYQLLNAVQSCVAKSESNAEAFIDDYLAQN